MPGLLFRWLAGGSGRPHLHSLDFAREVAPYPLEVVDNSPQPPSKGDVYTVQSGVGMTRPTTQFTSRRGHDAHGFRLGRLLHSWCRWLVRSVAWGQCHLA